MVTIEYMHICDYAFTTDDGKPCIIGVVDDINARGFPMRHPVLSIAIRFRAQAGKVFPVTVEFGRQNGEVLGAMEHRNVTIGSDGVAFVHLTMVNTPFPEPGRYAFKVSSNRQTLATQSIRARQAQRSVGH